MFETDSPELDNVRLPNLPSATPKTNGKTSQAAGNGGNGSASGGFKPPTVKWGDPKVQSGDGLNRIKATTERQVRFALIPGVDPVGAMTHFIGNIPRKGSYICPGAGCPQCLREDARWSVAALAVQYTSADANGKLAVEGKPTYSIGWISLSATHYATISEASEDKTPTDLDWVMANDGKRFSYRPVAAVPRYVKAGDEEAVLAMAKPLIPKLGNKIGRRVTALELKQLLSNAPTFEVEDADGE
jgi:hypothetical protein